MASIAKRPNGRWRARYHDPEGRQHARHFDRKVDAQHWLDNVALDLSAGVYVDPKRSRETFGGWASQWLAESVHLKPKTVAGYQSVLACHLLPRWGSVPVGRIDRPMVKAWVADLVAGGMAPGTVKNTLNAMKAVMRSALEGGAVKVNPVVGVRLPRPAKAEMLFLSAEEVRRLADASGTYRTLVYFAAYAGMRAGEIGALRWESVDLLRGRAEVRESFAEVHGQMVLGPTKTYAQRSVRLPRFLCEMLAADCPGPHPTGLVFRSPTGGPLRHSNYYRRDFKPAVARAGLPPELRFHDLRHTCVGLLVAQGAHPLAIKERLGHSSITVTLDQYGHLLPAVDEALVDGLDATYLRSLGDSRGTGAGLVVSLGEVSGGR